MAGDFVPIFGAPSPEEDDAEEDSIGIRAASSGESIVTLDSYLHITGHPPPVIIPGGIFNTNGTPDKLPSKKARR